MLIRGRSTRLPRHLEEALNNLVGKAVVSNADTPTPPVQSERFHLETGQPGTAINLSPVRSGTIIEPTDIKYPLHTNVYLHVHYIDAERLFRTRVPQLPEEYHDDVLKRVQDPREGIFGYDIEEKPFDQETRRWGESRFTTMTYFGTAMDITAAISLAPEYHILQQFRDQGTTHVAHALVRNTNVLSPVRQGDRICGLNGVFDKRFG